MVQCIVIYWHLIFCFNQLIRPTFYFQHYVPDDNSQLLDSTPESRSSSAINRLWSKSDVLPARVRIPYIISTEMGNYLVSEYIKNI